MRTRAFFRMLTDEEKQTILQEYESGETSVRALSRNYGVDHRILSKFIKDSGIEVSNRGRFLRNYDNFILKSIETHGVNYDYYKVDFKSWKEPVTIACNDCEKEFSVTPKQHINLKVGCRECHPTLKDENNLESFKKSSIEIHGEKYDYSKSIFRGNRSSLTVICPKHGDFNITPFSHLMGFGCENCKKESQDPLKIFIEKSNIVHNSFYSYEKSIYVNCSEPLIVSCPLHGDFNIRPS